jgi:hypothetical protein
MLQIEARAVASDGQKFDAELIALFFHPTPLGWRFYDNAARENRWQGGALSPEAQTFRGDVIAGRYHVNSRGGATREATFAHVRKLSDSTNYRPVEEGEPDQDPKRTPAELKRGQ